MGAEIYRTDDDGFLPTLQKKWKVINVEGDENKTKHQYICHFGINNLPINSFQDGLSTGLFHPLGHAMIDWLSMVLRLRQHNIGYTADGFYRSDDPTNSVKALKEGG